MGKMVEPLIDRLSQFKPLDENCRATLESLFGTTKRYPRHKNLAHDGETPEEVFLLCRGWAARYKVMQDGSRQILSFLLPGDVFPIHASASGVMDHGIVAVTECDVAIASASEFNRAVLDDGDLARAFWWSILVDKGILRAWVLNIGQRSAYCRIANLFCELHRRLKSVRLADDHSFDLPLTQHDIADAQGLTAVHVNRTMRQIKEDVLAEHKNKKLYLLDPERLCDVAEFDPAYLNPG